MQSSENIIIVLLKFVTLIKILFAQGIALKKIVLMSVIYYLYFIRYIWNLDCTYYSHSSRDPSWENNYYVFQPYFLIFELLSFSSLLSGYSKLHFTLLRYKKLFILYITIEILLKWLFLSPRGQNTFKDGTPRRLQCLYCITL